MRKKKLYFGNRRLRKQGADWPRLYWAPISVTLQVTDLSDILLTPILRPLGYEWIFYTPHPVFYGPGEGLKEFEIMPFWDTLMEDDEPKTKYHSREEEVINGVTYYRYYLAPHEVSYTLEERIDLFKKKNPNSRIQFRFLETRKKYNHRLLDKQDIPRSYMK